MSSPVTTIACLGPEGSFSHLLTEKRFPEARVQLMGNIGEVFDFLHTQPSALGIVPIENSSGGFIIDTVDRLVDERCGLFILEELTLDVKLALLGQAGAEVQTIHSHAMPFFHCDEWLKAHYPDAKRIVEPSTAKAAEKAAARRRYPEHHPVLFARSLGECRLHGKQSHRPRGRATRPSRQPLSISHPAE
ncbi:MAG: hypothetical protein NTV80_14195 [Verrucomicrobia bacterium]|nr:hypothetical protein [Verrucomicrobiota bacterium]